MGDTLPAHRFAKRTILHCKTHHFGTQNAPFWNAKRTILENGMKCLVRVTLFLSVLCSAFHLSLASNSVSIFMPSEAPFCIKVI